MSTRATFRFISAGEFDIFRDQTLFVDYDGCPKGAARKFKNAIAHKEDCYYFADKFFRANANANWTESHELHGDTKFRYTYDAHTEELTMLARVGYSETWQEEYRGTVEGFIDRYTTN